MDIDLDKVIDRYENQGKILFDLIEAGANKGEVCYLLDRVERIGDPKLQKSEFEHALTLAKKFEKLKIRKGAYGSGYAALAQVELLKFLYD